MSTFRAWLDQHGLGKYAALFAENDIGLDVLPDLTDADLEKLGVSLGDRRRILKLAASLEVAATSSERAITPRAETREAERRQLTVMFCDLVGSTELSMKLDPEDFREVVKAYQDACAEVVVRFEGQVAKYLGDGILVYFGFPQAHEDDAERAVHAALGIVKAMNALEPRPGLSLATRVGIATGRVVAGDLVGERVREEQAVLGDVPNLAARLQGIAEPDTVAISDTTRRLAGGVFNYDNLGSRTLKGISEPVQVWRAVSERAVESRFEARQARLTEFVGRKHEIGLLLDRWDQAKGGEGQVVLLSGEAGIGKSRLSEMLHQRLKGEPHKRLRYQCSPHHINSALHPVIRQLEFAARFAPDDTAKRKLDKLESLLAQSVRAMADVMPLFAVLLSVPTGDRYPALNMTPERQRERTLDLLADQLIGLAARQPVLFVLEDAHWIDPTTREFMDRIVARVANAPVLVVITFRPEFSPPWQTHGHATTLTLNRLTRQQCAMMVETIAGAMALPSEVLNQVIEKSDGVPLYVEELVKAVIEVEFMEGKADRYVDASPLLEVPTTLQDALLARVDRVAEGKEVAQIGAAIGREFPFEMLVAVSTLDKRSLENALEQFVEAGLIFRHGRAPYARYKFKHALVQDIVYDSLLLSRRRVLHHKIAEVLEDRFPGRRDAEPEVVARHFGEAGVPDRAITYWQRAGAKASEGSNYVEAASHLTEAVSFVSELPPQKGKAVELDLQMALGAVYRATKGTGSSQTEKAYARARNLCEELGQSDRLFQVIFGQYICAFNRPELYKAERYAAELAQIAEREGNVAAQLVADSQIGAAAFALGDFARARTHLERSLETSEVDRSLLEVYSQKQHPSLALTYLAWTLFALGYPDQAHVRSQEAVTASEGISGFIYAMALGNDCYLHHLRADCQAVEANVAILLKLAEEKGIVVYYELARLFEGWSRAFRGELDDGIALMREALAKHSETEQRLEEPYYLSILAETFMRARRWQEGSDWLDEALRRVEATDERWYEAELHRLTGELVVARDPQSTSAAEEHFSNALAVARVQSARLWELRAATSLARLWHDQGKATETRKLLAPVYESFTEGFDTPDLKEAKALLDELA